MPHLDPIKSVRDPARNQCFLKFPLVNHLGSLLTRGLILEGWTGPWDSAFLPRPRWCWCWWPTHHPASSEGQYPLAGLVHTPAFSSLFSSVVFLLVILHCFITCLLRLQSTESMLMNPTSLPIFEELSKALGFAFTSQGLQFPLKRQGNLIKRWSAVSSVTNSPCSLFVR